ncbi:4330_t:CDS:2 [Paraglomus brasilianum]|uniref:4330_t:CDS:1 n=1 Tax=Paraglomus brasilianum TaxID=144538 RepID=A0A9N9F4P7_9GLOM|nr:4330_t:CDS:2 [Paraglomus brasilianum]
MSSLAALEEQICCEDGERNGGANTNNGKLQADISNVVREQEADAVADMMEN